MMVALSNLSNHQATIKGITLRRIFIGMNASPLIAFGQSGAGSPHSIFLNKSWEELEGVADTDAGGRLIVLVAGCAELIGLTVRESDPKGGKASRSSSMLPRFCTRSRPVTSFRTILVRYSLDRRLASTSESDKNCPERAPLFAELVDRDILGNVPVRRQVVTIPKMLRLCLKYDCRLPDEGSSLVRNIASRHGSVSDAAADTQTCFLLNRCPGLFSTSTSR